MLKLFKSSSNPVRADIPEIAVINEVQKKILALIDEFAEKENLSIEAKNHLKKEIAKAVIQKTAEAYLQFNFSRFNTKLCDVVGLLGDDSVEASDNLYKKDVFYVKNTKHTLTYE